MLTLYNSVGNEFSHEIGHHFGMSDYFGENFAKYLGAHHEDSGWGYIGYRNKMRGNLNWQQTNIGDGGNGLPNFKKLYAYSNNAMSSGERASSISRYTSYYRLCSTTKSSATS